MSVIKKLAGETVYYGISSILGRILHFVILTPFLYGYFPEGRLWTSHYSLHLLRNFDGFFLF